MTMRLWGITGGTLSYSIDAFYVVPRITDMGTVLFPSNFFVMSFGSNGTMFTDLDTDETDVPFGGHHSVTQMRNNVMEAILFQTDIQEANDEISYYDLNGNGLWGGATDPPGADPQTWVTMMAAPVYLPQQSLLSDSFANSNINPGANIVVSTPTRFTKTLTQGNFSPPVAGEGVSEDSGNLRAILTANQTAPTPVTSSFIPHCTVFFGQLAVITGETSTPDHQHPLLLSLEDCTQTFSFDVDTVSEYRIFCGQTDNFGGALSEYVSNAAILEFDGAGNMDLSLVTSEASFVPTLGGDGTDARVTIDGPVNITSSLSTGTTYWLKVDRQRYFWRAKCWEDGSSEPDWQVSGFQYLVWRASGGGSPPRGTVAEPYNSNWVGDTDHDIVLRNPVDSRGVPFITFEAGFAQPQTTIRVFDYDLDLEPEGSSPVDMSIEEEKYDGTTWDSIVVPYSTKPSWRMVEGSLRNRNFNLDTNGFNLRVWKDAGGPVLQESAIAWVFQRARANAAVIPLFRPRVFSVSDV